MKVESRRSPYQKVAGLYHLARMLDKIRLHQAGKLPQDYHPNLGLSAGLDGHLCGFLGVDSTLVRIMSFFSRRALYADCLISTRLLNSYWQLPSGGTRRKRYG